MILSEEFMYRPRNATQRLYYDFHRQRGRGAKILDFEQDADNHYLTHYMLLRGVHAELHPFSYLKPGNHAVMVGFHDGFMTLGVSTLLITASLVGHQGHVWAFDPDPRNVEAARTYIDENGIDNVTVVEKGVWSSSGSLEFTFYKDFSSSNTVSTLHQANAEAQRNIWSAERMARESCTAKADVDTLDSLIKAYVGHAPDFVNLTINGAEAEALKGANKLLEHSRATIAFPINDPQHRMFEDLRNSGYTIVVADAPTKAWEARQFLYACAVKEDRDRLKARGYYSVRLLRTEPTSGENSPGDIIVDRV